MDRAEKRELVESLQKTFADSNLIVITRQSGLTVAEVSDLRTKIRDSGSSYKVAKNRLAKRALDGTKFQALQPLFEGPTAIAASEDPVAAAKVCVEFAEKNEKLTIVGGSIGETTLDADGVKALAKMPSLDESRAKLAGLIQTPAQRIATVLQAPAGQLARVFGAYADKDDAA